MIMRKIRDKKRISQRREHCHIQCRGREELLGPGHVLLLTVGGASVILIH